MVIFSLCNLGLSPSECQAATTATLLPQEQCGKSLAVVALMFLIFTIINHSESHFFCFNPTIDISIPLSTIQSHSLQTNPTICSLYLPSHYYSSCMDSSPWHLVLSGWNLVLILRHRHLKLVLMRRCWQSMTKVDWWWWWWQRALSGMFQINCVVTIPFLLDVGDRS